MTAAAVAIMAIVLFIASSQGELVLWWLAERLDHGCA
jgi:hypothetical protein